MPSLSLSASGSFYVDAAHALAVHGRAHPHEKPRLVTVKESIRAHATKKLPPEKFIASVQAQGAVSGSLVADLERLLFAKAHAGKRWAGSYPHLYASVHETIKRALPKEQLVHAARFVEAHRLRQTHPAEFLAKLLLTLRLLGVSEARQQALHAAIEKHVIHHSNVERARRHARTHSPKARAAKDLHQKIQKALTIHAKQFPTTAPHLLDLKKVVAAHHAGKALPQALAAAITKIKTTPALSNISKTIEVAVIKHKIDEKKREALSNGFHANLHETLRAHKSQHPGQARVVDEIAKVVQAKAASGATPEETTKAVAQTIAAQQQSCAPLGALKDSVKEVVSAHVEAEKSAGVAPAPAAEAEEGDLDVELDFDADADDEDADDADLDERMVDYHLDIEDPKDLTDYHLDIEDPGWRDSPPL